jgi:urease accessory protein
MRAVAVHRAGSWDGPAADRIALDYETRQRRRLALTAVGGLAFVLDLPRPSALRPGDALALEDGRLIAIEAAAEALTEARVMDENALARLAWHVGNRHLPAEIGAGWLRIRRDPVIAEMLRGLGAEVCEVEAPFSPEPGAYAAHGQGHAGAAHAH